LYVVDKGIVVPPDQDAWLRAYHAIDVGIHLRWKGGRDEPKFCQLIWREGILWRTEFAKPPHWNPDFRVVYPSGSVDNESTTFDNWVKRKNETQICPGENFSPIHLKDSASIMGFYAKLVVVQVSIEAPEGCECSPKKKEICFEFGLYRDSNSGVRNHLVKSHFKIFDCSNLAQHHHPSRIFPY
jgi:hypothetical protein